MRKITIPGSILYNGIKVFQVIMDGPGARCCDVHRRMTRILRLVLQLYAAFEFLKILSIALAILDLFTVDPIIVSSPRDGVHVPFHRRSGFSVNPSFVSVTIACLYIHINLPPILLHCWSTL